MDRASDAFTLMAERRTNCAQAVLSVYCETFGLERSLALRLAQGFGGGMGHTGKMCGAVSAAYMVLGLAHKMSPENPRECLDRTYALMREFDRKFKELHGSVMCTDLIGFDLSKPESLAGARDKKIFSTVCPDFVRDSVRILETLLQTG
jgi:C_GCAxxG_C_C family probable redox protein